MRESGLGQGLNLLIVTFYASLMLSTLTQHGSVQPETDMAADAFYSLYNSLQLPRVAQSVLDNHTATAHDILLRSQRLLFLLREVYSSILRYPASRLCELKVGAFGVQEEEVLGIGDWQ